MSAMAMHWVCDYTAECKCFSEQDCLILTNLLILYICISKKLFHNDRRFFLLKEFTM